MRTRKLSLYRALAGLALTATIAFVCTLFASAPSANAQYHEPAPEPVVVAPPPPQPKPKPVVHVPEPEPEYDVAGAKAAVGTSGDQDGVKLMDNTFNAAMGRVAERFTGQANSAGVAPAIDDPAVVTDTGGPANAIWAEYNYLDINDRRALGLSGDSNGLQVGYDVALPSGLVLGAIYGYDNRKLDSGGLNLGTETDTHAISAFVAQSILDNFSIGVVGGYANIDTDVNLRTPGTRTNTSVDAWNISPFIGAAYTNGAFSAFGNINYAYYDVVDTSQKLGIQGGAGYDLTEWLKLTGYVGYNYMIDRGAAAPDLPAMQWWLAFGAKLSARLAEPLEIYAGYEYDLYDDSDVDTHIIRAGLALHF